MNSEWGFFDRAWVSLRKPSTKYSVLAIGSMSFVLGILFWSGFNAAVEASNKLEFCISCHEMRDNVYQEYKKTVHYSNPVGVRVICSDCHVPRDWSLNIVRKVLSARELWGKVTGVIDTTEKFESRRMELATREWERMKASDSSECRNCHSLEAIRGTKEGQMVFSIHTKAKAKGKTCIDCHKGIAHLLPREYEDQEEE